MSPPPGRPKEGAVPPGGTARSAREQMSPLGGTARSAQGASSFPLDGLTIIDMTRLLPGPAATMHFVDFGADLVSAQFLQNRSRVIQ